MAIDIRPAVESDTAMLLRMIRSLAEYERLSDRVTATEAAIRTAFFSARPAAEAIVAEASGDAVGFAVFYPTFSTFRAAPGLYLEDIFVDAAWRRHGVGGALLARVAAIAGARGCHAVSWSVLGWNEPAIRFYETLGAEPVDEWSVYRLSGEHLSRLARHR
jgi:GNAT superfamily N-acetyltransferase